MAALLFTIALLSFYARVNAVGLHGFHFHGLEEPEAALNKEQRIREAWIEQPLDHFYNRDNRTWNMRYYENSIFLNKTGPIFICLGGEWTISTGFLQSGLMYEIAAEHGAMMYSTEHRFYGKSKPTNDTSSENMHYLSVDQALADIAYFIESKKKERGLENSPVFVFGGSYAGNMAAWARIKYPHLIQGALASSAPVFAKADFHEYYDVVAKSLGRYNQKCVTDVKAAFDAVEELLAVEGGSGKLKEYFNLCDALDVKSSSDIGYFMNILAETFAGTVQYDKVQNGRTKIAACCSNMTAAHLGSPLQRLAHLVSNDNHCTDAKYANFVKIYRNASWGAENASDAMRQWYYQTCTEYGYYQTTNSKDSIFGTLFPLDFFTQMCSDLYGDYHGIDILNSRVRRTNRMYGGLRPDVTNVIFTNGDLDPWHALSVLEDLNESSPAILIKDSSHCRDLYSDVSTDSDDLKRARARVRKIVGGWIASSQL